MTDRERTPKDRIGAATDEGSSLLEQVLRGERHLLLPPGTWAFVTAQLSLVVGAGLLTGDLTTTLVHDPRTGAATAMIALVGLTVALVVPGLLVVRGYRSAHSALVWIARVLVLVAVTSAAMHWTSAGDVPFAFPLASLGLFVIASLLLRSRPYAVFAGFYRAKRAFQLKRRKAAQGVLQQSRRDRARRATRGAQRGMQRRGQRRR